MNFDPNKDYYGILGVTPTAELAVIKAAYKALAAIYHPDKNSSEDAAVKMREYNEAWGVLSNPDNRKAYDDAFRIKNKKDDSSDWDEERSVNSANSTGVKYSEELIENAVHRYYERDPSRGRFLNIVFNLKNGEEFCVTLHDDLRKMGFFGKAIPKTIVGLLSNNYDPNTIEKEKLLSLTGKEVSNVDWKFTIIEFDFEMTQDSKLKLIDFIKEIVSKLVGENNIANVELTDEDQ